MEKNRKVFITLIIALSILIILALGVVIIFTLSKDKIQNKNSQSENTNHDIDFEIGYIDDKNIENNLLDESEKMARQSFNSMFEVYKGTDIGSAQIKQLLSLIETNNKTREDDKKVTIDEQGIKDKNQVSLDNIYEVQIFYADNGYINRVLIKERKNVEEVVPGEQATENTDKLVFNATFTPYKGIITGTQLVKLLNSAEENNNNSAHKIAFQSNNITSLNLDELTDEQKFEVSLGYDEDGYVNALIVDAK